MNTETDRTGRLFFAVWPDDETRDRLQQLQASVQGRKTHYADFHLTLVFLGNRPVEELAVLRGVLHDLPGLDSQIVIDRLGHFQRQKVVWAGATEPPPELMAIQKRLRHDLESNGVHISDPFQFTPHITLARKAEQPGRIEFAPIIWNAGHIVLAQSRDAPQGARYEVIASQKVNPSTNR